MLIFANNVCTENASVKIFMSNLMPKFRLPFFPTLFCLKLFSYVRITSDITDKNRCCEKKNNEEEQYADINVFSWHPAQ